MIRVFPPLNVSPNFLSILRASPLIASYYYHSQFKIIDDGRSPPGDDDLAVVLRLAGVEHLGADGLCEREHGKLPWPLERRAGALGEGK